MTKVSAKAVSMFMALVMSLGIVGSSFALAPAAHANEVFTVIFDLDGGYFSDPTTPLEVSVNSGETVGNPTDYPTYDWPQKDGYEFVGWFTDETYKTPFDFTQSIESDTTIYAKFLKLYTVRWNLNGATAFTGETQVDPMQVVDGYEAWVPTQEEIDHWASPALVGDEFLGVTLNGVFYKPGDKYVVKGDVTVEVLWKSQQPAETPTGTPAPTNTANAGASEDPSAAASKLAVGSLANTGAVVVPSVALLCLLAGGVILAYRRMANS